MYTCKAPTPEDLLFLKNWLSPGQGAQSAGGSFCTPKGCAFTSWLGPMWEAPHRPIDVLSLFSPKVNKNNNHHKTSTNRKPTYPWARIKKKQNTTHLADFSRIYELLDYMVKWKDLSEFSLLFYIITLPNNNYC